MDRPGRLRLDLFDACGDPLNERIDIYLHNQSLTDTVVARSVLATKPILIKNLLAAPNGVYRVFIDPPSFLPSSMFVNISGSKITERSMAFAADPDKVIRVEFPGYDKIKHAHRLLGSSPKVTGFDGISGEQLYAGIDDIRKAGLLNITAKCHRTPLTGGGVVLDDFEELLEARGDRVFVRVSNELHDRIRNSMAERLFRSVNGALHKRAGYEQQASYKTDDSYGNLQVTLFTRGDETVADVDIDDAAGLEHVFQVVRNAATREATHPYNIRDILLRRQEIDPGYRFVFHNEPSAKKASASKA
jgi:hypothetical protein